MLKGPFISSLTVTDIYSGWTENRALFTKQQAQVYRGLRSIEAILPFTIKHFNTDSGSEFLNTTIWRFTGFGNRIKFTALVPIRKRQLLCGAKTTLMLGELLVMTGLKIRSHHERYLRKTVGCHCKLFFIPFKLKEKNQSWSKNKEKYDSHKLLSKTYAKPCSQYGTQATSVKRKLQLNPFL